LPATESAAKDANAKYRYFYLKTDINQVKIIMLLLAVPLLGFLVNDFLFFGFSPIFIALMLTRFLLVGILLVEYVLIKRAKTYQAYDRIIVLPTLILLVGGGSLNLTRPENYIIHAIMAVVSIFALFLFIPTRYRYQCFLASFLTVGEIIIIILNTGEGHATVLFTLIISLLSAFVLAGYSSWQMHRYRHSVFEESTRRMKLQEQLRNNADNLAHIVDVRTQELVDAHARLVKSERLAAIGELAGMVGHDLRNPLAGIKNATYFLRKKNSAVIDESGRQMLANIDRSVEHADKIIGDLLEYSRDIKLAYSEQNPKSIINYVLLSLKIPVNIEVLDRTESSPTVMVDAAGMMRVFTNLIKNAFEAMPEGGVLEIVSRKDGENVVFVFSDTGVGIPEEVVSKLFTPLVTTKAQGMGFGLAICKRFVEAHGGEISVKSSRNKGTVFTVSIPQAPVKLQSSNLVNS
jgi:signal transduction histidine kinase